MSQENVEIMRTNFEEWNAGNMDAVRESFDPDVIMRTPEGWPEPGPYMGREAVMRQLEQNRATWDGDTFEAVSDFIDAADRVVVRMIWHGVPSASGTCRTTTPGRRNASTEAERDSPNSSTTGLTLGKSSTSSSSR